MTRTLYQKLDSMEYDGLISGVTPVPVFSGRTIRKLAVSASIVRGTVLAKSSADNKLVVLGNTAALSEQKFDGDGTAKTFTVTDKPLVISGVTVGGTAVTVTSYDASTGVVTLAAAPAEGTDNVAVSYAEEQLVPDCILADDIDVGTASDVNVSVYTAGCFDPGKLTVKSGYTITEADKDKLRERGIILVNASNI